MAKDKQKKHEENGGTAPSDKMSRKEFEKELAKLQVELTRMQTWGQFKGARTHIRRPLRAATRQARAV